MKELYGKITAQKITKIFDIFEKTIDPKTELNYSNNFELLIAVVLSAQTTDKAVNKATTVLFEIAKKPQDFIDLGYEELSIKIRTIGFFRNKSKHIIKLCERLISVYDGEVPNNMKDLESLAGVGPKTARVVLNTAFGHPVIAVDTHVHRLSNRIGISKTKKELQTGAVLEKRVPKKHLLNAHHYLILHGRYCCVSRKPRCKRCSINHLCTFKGE